MEASETAYPRLLRASTARCLSLTALTLVSGFGLAAALRGGASPGVALTAWAPALAAVATARSREAFGIGFGVGLCAAVGSLGFLYSTSARYLESTFAGGVAVALVALAIALPIGAAVAIGARLGRPRGLAPLGAAIALTLAERFVPSPIPYPLGTALVGWSDLAQGAATFSVFGLSLVAHLTAAALASAAAAAVKPATPGVAARVRPTALAALATVGAVTLAACLQDRAPGLERPSARVQVLGGPLGGRPSAPAASADVSLVVAPEAALDGVVGTADGAGLARALVGAGPPVLFGATTREGGRLHNRAILSDEEGRAADWIDKVELIPIAERTLDLATSYTSSPTDLVLRLRERRSDRELTVGVTICYEGLFPARVGAAAEGADVLVNLSNDRWFDEPRPIEAQILALRARAIETGLTTLRVARSGPSVVIDGDGREITRIDAGGSALVELPLGRPATIGRRLGAARDLPWLALAAATGALGSALTRRTPVRRP